MRELKCRALYLLVAVFLLISMNTFAAPFLFSEETLDSVKSDMICVSGKYAFVRMSEDLGHGANTEIHIYSILSKDNMEYVTKIWIPSEPESKKALEVSKLGIVNDMLIAAFKPFGDANISKCLSIKMSNITSEKEITDMATVKETVGGCDFEITDTYIYIKSLGDGKVFTRKINPRGFGVTNEIDTSYIGISATGEYIVKLSDGASKYDVFNVKSSDIGVSVKSVVLPKDDSAVKSILIKGNYLFIKTEKSVCVYGLQDENTECIGSFAPGGILANMGIAGNELYLNTSSKKMYMLDISNPAEGMDVTEKLLSGGVALKVDSFALQDGIVYAVETSSGISSYEITPCEVTDGGFFSSEGDRLTAAAAGKITYKLYMENYTEKDMKVIPVIMMYKNDELEGIAIGNDAIGKCSGKEISVSISVPECGYVLKAMVIDSLDDVNILSAKYDDLKLVETIMTLK